MRVWLMKSGMPKNGQQKLYKNKMVKIILNHFLLYQIHVANLKIESKINIQ